MKYDILIMVTEKDFNKLRFVYDSILVNLSGFNQIHVISDIYVTENYRVAGPIYYLDSEVLGLDFNRFEGNILKRKGWYKQQFIKLLQTVTADNYLVVDADIVFNKKIDVIVDNKPVFMLGKDQYNKPYFDLMKKVFKLNKMFPHSFINEVMFFQRKIIKHMLNSLNLSKYGFFEVIVKELNKANEISGFSEYELYGNYVTKHFPDAYVYKYMDVHASGKRRPWTDEEIETYIAPFKGSDCEIISMHTWI